MIAHAALDLEIQRGANTLQLTLRDHSFAVCRNKHSKEINQTCFQLAWRQTFVLIWVKYKTGAAARLHKAVLVFSARLCTFNLTLEILLQQGRKLSADLLMNNITKLEHVSSVL